MEASLIPFRPVVVVPTKNNSPSIAEVVRRSLAFLPDVVVVDDGSTDGSGDLARAAGATVLVHPENRGKGVALRTAFEWAAANGFSHAVTLDGDLQHLPEEIPRFVEAARAEPAAIVAGWRDMREGPEASRLGRRASNFWVWVATGWVVEDSQCGFRVYPLQSVLALPLRTTRYELEVEVLIRGLWAGIPVIDLPCAVYYPPKGERQTSFVVRVDVTRIILTNVRLLAEKALWPPRWRRHRALRTAHWRDRHRGTFLGWWIVVTLVRWAGRWPAYALVTALTGWFLVFAPTGRRAVQAYGARLGRSALGRRWLAVRVFHSFALSLIDRFLLLTHGPEQFEFDRAPEVLAAYEALEMGRGLVILSGHVGNPDLGAAAFHGRVNRPVNVLQYAGPNDPYVRTVRDVASERAPNLIPLNDGEQHASIVAIRALRRGEIVAMKADRPVDGRTIDVPFLDGRLRLPTGPFLLAALSGSPMIMLGCFKTGIRRYHVVASAPVTLAFTDRAHRDADVAQWARAFAAQLEVWVRRYPAQWYQFHDPFVSEP